MKKLMIAAAAAAMVGGAFAEEKTHWDTPDNALFQGVLMDVQVDTNKTPWVTNYYNTVRLDQTQIVMIKYKATTGSKFFCLNDKKNIVESEYKPSAVSAFKSAAFDGAIYYDGDKWIQLAWGKDWANVLYKGEKGVAETDKFAAKCYLDKGGKKVWGAVDYSKVETPTYDSQKKVIPGKSFATNARCTIYSEVDTDKDMMKNLKTTSTSKSYSLKTYKDAKAVAKAVDAIEAKWAKAGGKLADLD